jgi:hypothetical protein
MASANIIQDHSRSQYKGEFSHAKSNESRSKAGTVFARSEAGIVGSNTTQSMDVWCVCMCLFCVCVVLCLGRGLATSWSLVQGVLPSVKMIMKSKKRPGPKGAVEPVKKKSYERWLRINSLCGPQYSVRVWKRDCRTDRSVHSPSFIDSSEKTLNIIRNHNLLGVGRIRHLTPITHNLKQCKHLDTSPHGPLSKYDRNMWLA